jgi:hypothetical protein
MAHFVLALASSFVTVTLGLTGLWHIVYFRRFRDIIRSHRSVPPAAATATAGVVCVLELSTVLLLTRSTVAFLIAAAAGCGFLVYVGLLLGHVKRSSACGCSPFESKLTAASLLPAGGLAIVSGFGYLASSVILRFGLIDSNPFSYWLGIAWGVTIAWLVLLTPASFGSPEGGRFDA